jgi:hypothetical protein
MQDARTIALPLVCWVWPMAQTMVLGRFFAICSATSRTSASFMPVTFSTSSGVHLAASLRTSSMP